jgi:hypothetical protein
MTPENAKSKYPAKNKKPADGEYTFYVFNIDTDTASTFCSVKVNKLGQKTCKVQLSCSVTGAYVATRFDAAEKGKARLAAFLKAASGTEVNAADLTDDNFTDAITSLACGKKVRATIKRRDDYVAPNGTAYPQYNVSGFAPADPF